MGELEPKTRQLLREQLPKVFKMVLARALMFAQDPRVHAYLGGDAGRVAEELVQEAVLRTLTGHRVWDPERVDLERFLVQAVRSIADSYKDRGARKVADHDDEVAPSTLQNPGTGAKAAATPEDRLIREDAATRLENALIEEAGDDEDLLALVDALLEGVYLPRDLEQELDWSSEKVAVVFKKLRRRMRKRPTSGGVQ